ncbi:hypothetical protein HGRIS_013306 [Hohenbuehelia grisea]|uniref:Uncharacterized protein n=1 Tax=Hohenbuehelia grisea TaxID=104357 RepID=A0ABR3IV63_9AGAR
MSLGHLFVSPSASLSAYFQMAKVTTPRRGRKKSVPSTNDPNGDQPTRATKGAAASKSSKKHCRQCPGAPLRSQCIHTRKGEAYLASLAKKAPSMDAGDAEQTSAPSPPVPLELPAGQLRQRVDEQSPTPKPGPFAPLSSPLDRTARSSRTELPASATASLGLTPLHLGGIGAVPACELQSDDEQIQPDHYPIS